MSQGSDTGYNTPSFTKKEGNEPTSETTAWGVRVVVQHQIPMSEADGHWDVMSEQIVDEKCKQTRSATHSSRKK